MTIHGRGIGMNSQAKKAVIVLLIGVALMAIGQAWSLVAESDYQKAMRDEINAYTSPSNADYINALWEEYNAINSGNLADSVFTVGLIVAFLGVAVLAVGMIPPKPALVQQAYPPGYQVMQAPPAQPEYQEPPRQ